MRTYLGFGAVLLLAVLAVFGLSVWQSPGSFVFAWVLNFMLMTILLAFTQLFKPQLTSSYFQSKSWERNGKIYEWVGVNGFRKLLVWVGWEKLNKAANPVKKDLNALKHLEYTTRQSEFGHLVIFLISLPVTLYVILNCGFRQSIWLLSLNIILNLYPIVVQRYNRPRLQKMIRVSGRFGQTQSL